MTDSSRPITCLSNDIEDRLALLDAMPDEIGGLSREAAREITLADCAELIYPGHPDYERLRLLAYANFRNIYPRVIARCRTTAEVSCLLALLRRYRIPFAPRSGGHSTAGYSSVDKGLMLDLRDLDFINVDTGRKVVHVGPGVQFRDFYKTLGAYNLFAPAGICSAVRVGGFMQGGGYGFASRMFGLNCDNVVELECVLADGRIVLANADTNSDLYWAVRGGTGNNFCIVTRVTYRLFDLKTVSAVRLRWNLETADGPAQGARALQQMQEHFMKSNRDSRIGYMAFIHANQGVMEVAMRAMVRGPIQLQRELLSSLRNLRGCEVEGEAEGTYVEMNGFLYPEASNRTLVGDAMSSPVMDAAVYEIDSSYHRIEPNNDAPFQEKFSRFYSQHLGFEHWLRVVRFLLTAKRIFPTPLLPQLNIEAYGAAIDDRKPSDMAYVHRNHDFNAFLHAYWRPSEGETGRTRAMTFLRNWLATMGDHEARTAYQNYPKPYVDNWERRYWGSNYPLLKLVKTKYDPSNLFNFEQGIGRGFEPNSEEYAEAKDLAPAITKALEEPIADAVQKEEAAP